ncbi:MAG: hypothetical protein DRI54_04090 [Bacteroidetes bacterium]|nr:MAG: hypothetical protein DRI54_04090 [Bacteroidota bacterium]
MKINKTVILLLIIFFSHTVFSQDLIVTLTNDSLNCKITQIESEYVHFNYVYNEEVRNTVLLTATLKTYQENYYKESEIPARRNSNIDYSRFHLIISGGGSYLFEPMLSDVNEDLKDYYQELKIGYNLGFDVNYYFNRTIGLGIKYNYFNSSSSYKESFSGDGSTSSWDISENIMMNFVGPTFLARFLSKKNGNAFIVGVSAGYMWYKDDVVNFDSKIVTTGNTLGFNVDASYHISLSEKLFLGFSVSTTLGFLNKVTLDDGLNIKTFDFEEFQDYKNVSRADLSIKFGFKL